MDILLSYWSKPELVANGLIVLHLLGALAVGVLIGYERSYHGRAAGMRTYALVCVASTALTVVHAYPQLWYGGMSGTPSAADPTRVIQGIMTGIGFLGAGVIMKEGFTIRGLSTAASIWTTAAIGVLIGIGFYAASMVAALMAVGILSGFRWIEERLPHQSLLHLSFAFARNDAPTDEAIRELVRRHGFEVADWAFQSTGDGERFEFQLVLAAMGKGRANELARDLCLAGHVLTFRIAPSRS